MFAIKILQIIIFECVLTLRMYQATMHTDVCVSHEVFYHSLHNNFIISLVNKAVA